MIRLFALLFALTLASPAEAHKLKVFATTDGTTVSGYGFFIGGGRAAGAHWSASIDGAVFAEGQTGPDGAFAATPQPVTGDVTVTVDTQEGHAATTTLPADRFGAFELAEVSDPGPPAGASLMPETGPATGPATAPGIDTTALEALVEQAVNRQVTPLLKRIEEMDARMRYTDILSAVFLILGLGGLALWARGRK